MATLLTKAAAMGVVGSYSFGSGLLVWPIGLLFFRHRPLMRGQFAILVVAAISVGAYFLGYQSPPHHPDPWYAAKHPALSRPMC